MSWKRPNIGSRVNREVHARFWERAEVKFLRATRQIRPTWPRRHIHLCPLCSDSVRISAAQGIDAECQIQTWQESRLFRTLAGEFCSRCEVSAPRDLVKPPTLGLGCEPACICVTVTTFMISDVWPSDGCPVQYSITLMAPRTTR